MTNETGTGGVRIVIDGAEIKNPMGRVFRDPGMRGMWLDQKLYKWDKVHIYSAGVTPDGKVVPWDLVHEPNPASVGNNNSRLGFSWNPYHSKMGRLFQETVKNVLEKTIIRIHDREILRYDKNAYQFDDERIAYIVDVLRTAMEEHMDDNDSKRKHALFGAVIDLLGFTMKEDVFYRGRVLMSLKNLAESYIANPKMFELTDAEGYNYTKFRLEKWLDNSIGTYTFTDYMKEKHGEPPVAAPEGEVKETAVTAA